MRIAPAAAVLVVLIMSVAHGQQNPDPFDPMAAVPRAWALLTAAIDSTVVADQAAAIRALAAADTPRAREVIERLARDRSYALRRVAIGSLARDVGDISLIADALGDADVEIRRAAIQRLGWIRDPRAAELLRTVILRGDDTLETAIGSARLLGRSSLGGLVQAVQGGGERSREAAIRCIEWLLTGDTPESTENLEALRRLRPEPVLVKALADGNRDVRAFAALILARLGDAAGADELRRMTEASDPRFGAIVSRHYAMAALHVLGRPGYLEPLVAALANNDGRVRLDAALAMRSFARASMYDAWNAVWKGESPSDVRYWAFHGLIAISNDTGLLRAGLVDRDPGIRLRAAERLMALGPDPASVDVLERLATEPATRNLALSFLSRTSDPTRTAAVVRTLLPRTVEDLDRMRTGNVYDPEYRLSVVAALERLKDRESVPALDALLTMGADSDLVFCVVRALAAIGDGAARRSLIRAMESPSSTVRIHAAGGVLSE